MYDICNVFKRQQKIFQKSNLIILDVITARDAAIEQLNIAREMPFPGGKEEQLGGVGCITVKLHCVRAERHINMCHLEAGPQAIRIEIIESAINFLDQRMNIENDETIVNLKAVLDAKSPKEIITASRYLASEILGEGLLSEFASDVCLSWEKLKQLSDVRIDDQGTYYALKLRKMAQSSSGLLRKFLASFLCLSPHSMATERAVSHYNNIKTTQRSSLSQESINNTMHISLNGVGTANYDARPAVYTFLQIKDRRDSCPNEQLYKERDFIKNFFANKA